MPAGSFGTLTVFPLGLGSTGTSDCYGPGDEQESLATVARALDRGCTVLDTADMSSVRR